MVPRVSPSGTAISLFHLVYHVVVLETPYVHKAISQRYHNRFIVPRVSPSGTTISVWSLGYLLVVRQTPYGCYGIS